MTSTAREPCWPRLETLRQGQVPDPTSDIGLPWVVAVLEGASDKRCREVGHLVHPKCDCCVIEPSVPPAPIVLRGGGRHDVLCLTVVQLRVPTRVLAITGNFVVSNRSGRCKRVVQNEIKCRPFTNFTARRAVSRNAVTVPILPNVVNDDTGVESAQA